MFSLSHWRAIIFLLPIILGSNLSIAQNNLEGDSAELNELVTALKVFKEDSIFNTDSLNSILPDIVQNQLKNIDPYVQYLSLEQSQYRVDPFYANMNYMGIGLLLRKDQTGRFFLNPYPNSPAQQAGINYGDQLIEVDNHKLFPSQSIIDIANLMRGDAHTRLKIKIFSKEKKKLMELTIPRGKVDSKTVWFTMENGLSIIKIFAFTSKTADEFYSTWQQLPKKGTVVIDLIGNGGGNVQSAISIANYLIPKDRLITELQEKKEGKALSYYSNNGSLLNGHKLILWQDEETASASELLISALTQNRIAISIGSRSYGKAVAQRFLNLGSDHALLYSYARIIPPNGMQYNKIGLKPTIQLLDNSRMSYLIETKKQTTQYE